MTDFNCCLGVDLARRNDEITSRPISKIDKEMNNNGLHNIGRKHPITLKDIL